MGEAVALCGMCLEEEAHYYLRQKRFDRAKRPHAEALALAKRVLGPEHEQVAVMLNNMSTILEGLGEVQAAYEMATEAAHICRKTAPQNLPAILHNIAILRWKQLGHADDEVLGILKEARLLATDPHDSALIDMSIRSLSRS